MKNIITGIFLFLSFCLIQAQTPNYYRNSDKIYLDSESGHNGNFAWQMYKADEIEEPAEKISAGSLMLVKRFDYLSLFLQGRDF